MKRADMKQAELKQDGGWLLFDTVRGPCGISWRDAAVTRFLLPDNTVASMQRELRALTGQAQQTAQPPRWLRDVVKQVQRHCDGKPQDFTAVPVHTADLSEFTRTVYRRARAIPAGEVLSYAELATAIGKPGAARAVGTALGRNQVPLLMPCHRIVARGGKPGGFTSPGGLDTKRWLLACEGVALEKPRVLTTAAQWQQALQHLRRDKAMAALIRRVGTIHFRPQRNEEPLAAFIDALASQQLATKVAATILKRVHAVINVNGTPSAAKILATPDSELRAAGLSGMKVSCLKDLAQHSVDGKLPSLSQVRTMSDEQLVRCFTAVKGIGRWSVEMYLIFDLGRADVFPADDYGIRKAVAQLHGLAALPPAKALAPYAEAWRPYRTVASLYLWRSVDGD